MPTLAENKEALKGLATKALQLVEDATVPVGEKKTKLDALETDIKRLETEIADQAHVEEARKRYLGMQGATDAAAANDTAPNGVAKSLGAQFVESAGYKGLVEKGIKGVSWSSGEVELKTTLAESGGGAALVSQPQLLPGVVQINLPPLDIEDLFGAGTAEQPTIKYYVETAITNAAAETAEAGAYPESAISFDDAEESLKKVATFLPVTEEMLEDWSQTQSYIDGRLVLFIKQRSRTQLLTGNGTGQNLLGLLNRSGLATTIVKGTAPSVTADNNMDAIYRQITAIRVGAFVEPDAITCDPLAWQAIVLSKNDVGAYYAGGPFMDVANPSVWGKKVVPAVGHPANKACVGAFKTMAQVFSKGGIAVEASNSHSDWFTNGKVAIRARRRMALAVYRPGAFGLVDNLTQ